MARRIEARNLIGVTFLGLAMWKAVLILFVTSQTSPLRMIPLELPGDFDSEKACREHLSDLEAGLEGTIGGFLDGSGHAEVVNHHLTCIEDDSGREV